MSRVPGIRPGIWRTIKAGMTVVVAWVRAGHYARQQPYIKGRSSSKLSPICEATENDWLGRIPSGIQIDSAWQSDSIGNAYNEYPASFVMGRIAGRPVGWICAARGSTLGAYSGNATKQVTCFDLHTGETIWRNDIYAPTQINANFAVIQLHATRGEILLCSQDGTGVGPHTLKRLSACTGEVLATSGDDFQDEAQTFGDWHPLGDDYIAGSVPPYTFSTAVQSLRLQVYRRAPIEGDGSGVAFVPAYQIVLPTGGPLVGVGAAGGATVGGYYAPRDQALLLVADRQAISGPIIRARVIAWEVRSGKILWQWSPHDGLGLPQYVHWIFSPFAHRDPNDGSIYFCCRLDRPSPAHDMSYFIKLSVDGEIVWTQEVDSTVAGGKFFNPFGRTQIVGGNLLSSYQYNVAPAPGEILRPILMSRSGGQISEGPGGWSLYGGGLVGSGMGNPWVYCFTKIPTPPGTTIRYHLADGNFGARVTWEHAVGASRHTLTTPDAGPAALFAGWIYGINWDVATGWRVRRWN